MCAISNGDFLHYFRLDVDSKLPEMLKLTYLACRSEDKTAALLHLIKNLIDQKQQTIVFAATKHHVEFIHQVSTTVQVFTSVLSLFI